MSPKPLKFRPYARLLTMLGDQLIRNEQVALSELIKNAYDADASWVKVTFQGFDGDFRGSEDSKIIIEDDGIGMTTHVIENHWVNPATPMKRMSKKGSQATTPKGRIIQGEKGIGRFALLKLGRDIAMTTRPIGSTSENVVSVNLSQFDEDFFAGDRPMFLEELDVGLSTVQPAVTIIDETIDVGGNNIRRAPYGTRIEISSPAGLWSRAKVEKIFEDISRLQSSFTSFDSENAPDESDSDVADESPVEPTADPKKFSVFIYRDDEYEPFAAQQNGRLETLLKDNTVFRIEGSYDESKKEFSFAIDRESHILPLSASELTEMPIFRDYLKRHGLEPSEASQLSTACGSFGFSLYVFDFSNDATGRRELEKPDKELIKRHRIYLYRDGIRVYPYGDPDDDWLLIDIRRGTVKASEFMSNDQVVGFVNISQAANPQLKDKTSREGLVDTGQAVDDFRALLQTFLAWVRKRPYAEYKKAGKLKHDVDAFRSGKVQTLMDEVVSAVSAEGVPSEIKTKVAAASREYKAERRYLVQRAESTEHLAGVGLSVEAASHDLMIAMQRVMAAIDKLMLFCDGDREIDKEALRAELVSMRGLLSFVQTQMSDMQLLFRSTKQRRKDIRVGDLVDKVRKIFKSVLDRHSISVNVVTAGSPLVAKTTDAVLLQLLLNLFDNATYWLQSASQPREIEILLDGDNNTMTFADNGPGFRADDLPYLFEPFFSGKGEDGRGLGLYIARQLLERHEYSIAAAEKDEHILPGANLIVSFVRGQ